MTVYSADIIKIAKTYNINERDVAYCYLIAGGMDRGDAYYCIYEHRTQSTIRSAEQARTKANELLKAHPGMQVLISRLKTRKTLNTADAKNEVKNEGDVLDDDELKKFTDKSYIIAQLSQLSKSLGGKERGDVLMKIADLQRMKNEETKEKEEVRRFYLPYISKCRGCKVFALLREALGGAITHESD